MAFKPSSNIYIGSVPFDPSYRHVRHFSDRSEQLQWFLGRCPMQLRREDYTYQRADGSLVVPFNAEDLYGYNYCMYQNENYGTRWFYCFIVNVEYVNPSSSRLTLQTDVMQTWYLDCETKPCPVEREHVDDDTWGLHIKDEGFNPGELKVEAVKDDGDGHALVAVAASAVEPLEDGTYRNVSGGGYQNVWCGTKLYGMKSPEMLRNFMNALSSNGQQDAISDLYMVPDYALGDEMDGDLPYNQVAYPLTTGGGALTKNVTMAFNPYRLDGYKPKNNKTLCFPNQYIEVNNMSGGTQNFRFEFFDNPAKAVFQRWCGFLPASTVAYMPMDYNGRSGKSPELSVYLDPFPTLSWVYQTYANQYGRSQVEIGPIHFNSLVDLPKAQTFMQMAGRTASMADDIENIALATASGHGKASIGSIANVGGKIAENYLDVAQYAANLQYAQRAPNTSRGGLNSTTAAANFGQYQMKFIHYVCRAEIAEMIDDFYTAFGYRVDCIKVPNVTGRASFNYVKTNGMNVQGKVPAPVKAAINSIFDKGTTFWHVDDIGNYSLDNSIV